MSILLIAEHDNSSLKVFTLNAICAASKIDEDIHVLVAGKRVKMLLKKWLPCRLLRKFYIQNLKITKTT